MPKDSRRNRRAARREFRAPRPPTGHKRGKPPRNTVPGFPTEPPRRSPPRTTPGFPSDKPPKRPPRRPKNPIISGASRGRLRAAEGGIEGTSVMVPPEREVSYSGAPIADDYGGDPKTSKKLEDIQKAAIAKDAANRKARHEKSTANPKRPHTDTSSDEENQVEAFRKRYGRQGKQEGGLLVPPEMEELPIDTYTPEDQANAEETQVSDEEMEDGHVDFILDEALVPEEQEYLMNTLEADPKLSQIIDKVVGVASEFSGSGEVEGPGDGVSDSIPARLSDGEFVFTEKATNQLGADNLQQMMDDAERAYDGGLMRKNRYLGGTISKDELELRQEDTRDTDKELRKLMTIKANKAPSLR